MSHFHPPPPYSTHIHSAEQVLDFDLGVSICEPQRSTHSLTLQSHFRQLILSHLLWCPIYTPALLYRTQISMKAAFFKRHPRQIKSPWTTFFHIPPSGWMSASAYLNYDYAKWYDVRHQSRTIANQTCSSISRLQKGFVSLIISSLQTHLWSQGMLHRLDWKA